MDGCVDLHPLELLLRLSCVLDPDSGCLLCRFGCASRHSGSTPAEFVRDAAAAA
jgi:hypothetical protein